MYKPANNKYMKYTFTIKEVLKRTVEVKASNQADAYIKVENLYNDEEIVLDYNDLWSVDITMIKDENA
jgi:hypothetical protein